MRIKSLKLEEVKEEIYVLAKKLMTWDQPFPDFETRSPNILESCLAIPFQTFGKKDLYKGLIKKAAILFYLMNKNHPFFNGNKRMAVVTLLFFLEKNNKNIRVSSHEFYKFSLWVVESNPKLKNSVVKAIEEFLEKNMVNLKVREKHWIK